MPRRSIQSPQGVVMVCPHHFHPNPATAHDNGFQSMVGGAGTGDSHLAIAAHAEVTRCAEALEALGVTVHLFEEEAPGNPDAVFPNNWFSTHAGGHVAVYPMYSPSRRRERRVDIVDMLKTRYRVQDVIDLSGLEEDGLFLEGTGSMVLDHVERVAYVARSNRASEVALERFCAYFGFEPMIFDTMGPDGRPVYHTNVMMSIGDSLALAGLSLIPDPARRMAVAQRIEGSGRSLIDLDMDQIMAFAGNALELTGRDGPILAMSARGVASLTHRQRTLIERNALLLPLAVPTIELAGGSVRCMMAGIHLAPRPLAAPVPVA